MPESITAQAADIGFAAWGSYAISLCLLLAGVVWLVRRNGRLEDELRSKNDLLFAQQQAFTDRAVALSQTVTDAIQTLRDLRR